MAAHCSYAGMSYQGLSALIGTKGSMKLANFTWAFKGKGYVEIRYHSTAVVTMFPNGSVVLNSGGFHTKSTLERMNWFSGVHVYQRRGAWFVGQSFPVYFHDGMRITKGGNVKYPETTYCVQVW